MQRMAHDETDKSMQNRNKIILYVHLKSYNVIARQRYSSTGPFCSTLLSVNQLDLWLEHSFLARAIPTNSSFTWYLLARPCMESRSKLPNNVPTREGCG